METGQGPFYRPSPKPHGRGHPCSSDSPRARTTIIGPNGGIASTAGPPLPSPAYTSQQVSGIDRLAAGQFVHVEVLQGSGGSLAARLVRFEIVYVGGY